MASTVHRVQASASRLSAQGRLPELLAEAEAELLSSRAMLMREPALVST
jgi:hypothetical protein